MFLTQTRPRSSAAPAAILACSSASRTHQPTGLGAWGEGLDGAGSGRATATTEASTFDAIWSAGVPGGGADAPAGLFMASCGGNVADSTTAGISSAPRAGAVWTFTADLGTRIFEFEESVGHVLRKTEPSRAEYSLDTSHRPMTGVSTRAPLPDARRAAVHSAATFAHASVGSSYSTLGVAGPSVARRRRRRRRLFSLLSPNVVRHVPHA